MRSPGVGQRLMDHPSISVSAYVKPHARINEFTRRHIHVGLRYSSNLPGMHEGDMFVVAVTKSAWHAVGERIASFLIAVYHTCSERGEVKLTSRDWREEPLVEFNLLSDRRDLERLMQAFRMMGKLYATPAMQEVTSDPFPATYSERVRKVGVVNTRNKLMTAVAGALLDGPAALRSYLIRNFITEGFTFEQVMSDDEALRGVRAQGGDRGVACLLQLPHGRRWRSDGGHRHQGRVRGVDGLRVVDASIFPLVPCANTNFPTLMTAEKIADAISAVLARRHATAGGLAPGPRVEQSQSVPNRRDQGAGYRMRIAELRLHAERQLLALPGGDMQRAEHPVPDGQAASHVPVEVDWIGGVVNLMVGWADEKRPSNSGESDPEVGVVQVCKQVGKDHDDRIAARDDKLRRLLAEREIRHALGAAHHDGKNVVEDDAVDRMHAEICQRRQHLGRVVHLVEFPQELDAVTQIVIEPVAEFISDKECDSDQRARQHAWQGRRLRRAEYGSQAYIRRPAA